MNYVFHNQQLVREYDPSNMSLMGLGDMAQRCPSGAYIYNSQQRNWFVMSDMLTDRSYSKHIPEHTVPNWAKALLLLIT